MKNLLKTLFGGTAAAWEMLIDLPLPAFCRRLFYSPCISPSALAAGFTAVGFLIGLFIALIGTFGRVPSQRIAQDATE